MNQGSLFTGQPVMSQLLELVPRSLVERTAREHNADRYCKTLFSYDHVVTMLSACFWGCTSLQELISGMQASERRLLHLGLASTPCKSTLADANKRRPEAFFGELFHALYRLHHGVSPDSPKGMKGLLDKLHILDSTTISLFSDVMHGTGSYGTNGRKKGGAKAHVVMRARDEGPCFIDLTEGKRHDQHMLPLITLPSGSVIVFDMGYNNYGQWRTWDKQGVWWATRMKKGTVVSVLENLFVPIAQRQAGVLSDQRVRLGSSRKGVLARLVRYKDAKTGREFAFLTNNMRWAASTVAHIYKRRWDIELLFRRVKQNFPLRCFLGESPNAIKIQIWCAFMADLLINVVRRKVQRLGGRTWAFANLVGLVRIHLGTYIDLTAFLLDPYRALLHYQRPVRGDPKQLYLFT
jgi:hypothetical protein